MALRWSLFACWMIFVLPLPGAVSAEVVCPLFNGQDLTGWQTVDGKPIQDGWEVVEGEIHLRNDRGRVGDIVTTRQFCNFDLQFEWKITAGANSGVKYRVRNFAGRVLGCEFQILDDAMYPEVDPRHSTGSLYDMYRPTRSKSLRPAGQYNHARILVYGSHIEHWLNGRRLLTARVGGCHWRQQKANSKFSDVSGFGEIGPGRIMLTDHNSEVWYRNLTLRPLAVHPRLSLATLGHPFRRCGLFRTRFLFRRCR
ncbi:MAG: glycosyl hydrolase [Planctomycetaceae bacterium]|nr:glycosyl hydrolase [Planctomycetaceae bacterium]MBP62962.1 glycosyl hydrolase [Planctomycetaceae bacterium]